MIARMIVLKFACSMKIRRLIADNVFLINFRYACGNKCDFIDVTLYINSDLALHVYRPLKGIVAQVYQICLHLIASSTSTLLQYFIMDDYFL